MNTGMLKFTTIAALTTALGTGMIITNANADDRDVATTESKTTQVVSSYSQSQQALNQVTVASANAAQQNTSVRNPADAQTINYPANYNIDQLRKVDANNQSSVQQFDKVAKPGLTMNNYQSNATAANEKVDIVHSQLTNQQTTEMNQYALGLVNQARAGFNEGPFIQNQGTINNVKGMALQYQNEKESLLKQDWHDPKILNGYSENISAMEIYADNNEQINGIVRPFATAKGIDFINSHSIPLFSVTNMDDLRAMIYYGVTTMLFNDASDNYSHAQNFLTTPQPIMAMAVYPSVLDGQSHATVSYDRGKTVTSIPYAIKLVDMHFIWAPSNGDTDGQPGFHLTDGKYTYYDNQGNMVHGERQIGNSWYYFNPSNGVMAVGLTKLPDGRQVYYDGQGKMVHGERNINGNWYHFAENNGNMSKGLIKLSDGRLVYYDNQGKMAHGERNINGSWYHFAENNGNMSRGFTKLGDGRLVYYDNQGKMAHGERNVNGSWYHFAENNGDMSRGFTKLHDGRLVYYDGQGKMAHGERNVNGSWYHFAENNGDMSRGFTKLNDGRLVYYDSQGKMAHGERYLNGNWYHFAENNGNMSKGFTKLHDGRTVYYDNQGHMLHGTHVINGKTYRFNRYNGAL
ncbi:SEC10/PgrA surface exclusion domain-containing protein [Limosilactobacillus pontis]|uniref:SEC10/PgrA surface exclusion domain-containing protein n=1 Tax=Limosilactobacillus pontis TaxID=35787 RepID=UPI002F2613E2